jgi:enolase
MTIEGLDVREILDSRGNKTIEVEVISYGRPFVTKIPSGKSRGENEAAVLEYKDAKSVLDGGLRNKLLEKEFKTIESLDKFLIKWDSTQNKSKIGGNLSLGISVSFARALATRYSKELWEVLHDEYFARTEIHDKTPVIFSNMINGGAHAHTNLDIQEYIVLGRTSRSITETVESLKNLYKELGEYLKGYSGLSTIPLGDEKGYAIDFTDNFEPIKILEEIIYKNGYEKLCSLGTDAAASNFYKDGVYYFGGETLDAKQLAQVYIKYFGGSKLLYSIEDPFDEEDVKGFKNLFDLIKNGKIIVGDDLTTTNKSLIEQYGEKIINGVIIKPNQIGTVTETCSALNIAGKKRMYRIVSHRSGEVDDAFIIHFAKAAGAEGVKIGAPAGERLYKFEELIRVYT